MRILSNNEINNVTGAGYGEDIATAAASLYVASKIGGTAAAISYAAFSGAASIAGMGPCAYVIAATGSMVSPMMAIAAPVLAFEAVYPGVIAEKVGAYLN